MIVAERALKPVLEATSADHGPGAEVLEAPSADQLGAYRAPFPFHDEHGMLSLLGAMALQL